MTVKEHFIIGVIYIIVLFNSPPCSMFLHTAFVKGIIFFHSAHLNVLRTSKDHFLSFYSFPMSAHFVMSLFKKSTFSQHSQASFFVCHIFSTSQGLKKIKKKINKGENLMVLVLSQLISFIGDFLEIILLICFHTISFSLCCGKMLNARLQKYMSHGASFPFFHAFSILASLSQKSLVVFFFFPESQEMTYWQTNDKDRGKKGKGVAYYRRLLEQAADKTEKSW